ncbi:MAG: phosphate-starvation-inducible PsiE family protein [Terriglobales bacterium]
MPDRHLPVHPTRDRLTRGLSFIEDMVYVGLGALLGVAAIALLFNGFRTFVNAIRDGSLSGQLVQLLDQLLLVMLVIELLYTVQVSFREHGLMAEPFLVVALIAVIRRVLVLTAEIPQLAQANEAIFRHATIELAVLTVMIVVLVGSVILLQKQARRRQAGVRQEAKGPYSVSDIRKSA